MTKTIENKFQEPNRANVSTEDFLVICHNFFPTDPPLTIYPIHFVGDRSVIYRDNRGELRESSFDESVILRNDGIYFVGKGVPLYE